MGRFFGQDQFLRRKKHVSPAYVFIDKARGHIYVAFILSRTVLEKKCFTNVRFLMRLFETREKLSFHTFDHAIVL